jgi:hypothetical protein
MRNEDQDIHRRGRAAAGELGHAPLKRRAGREAIPEGRVRPRGALNRRSRRHHRSGERSSGHGWKYDPRETGKGARSRLILGASGRGTLTPPGREPADGAVSPVRRFPVIMTAPHAIPFAGGGLFISQREARDPFSSRSMALAKS